MADKASDGRSYTCGFCLTGNHPRCVLAVDTPSGHHECACGSGGPHEEGRTLKAAPARAAATIKPKRRRAA